MAFGSRCHRRSAASYAICLLVMGWAAMRPAHAVESANCRELERRYDLVKADITADQLNSALFSAAEVGCQELVRAVLEAGASLEARDRLGDTPLAYASRAGQRAMVELLLSVGAQIDSRDISGDTALYLAAEGERQATVAFLLTRGADPNLPGRGGATPLVAAARKGNDRIVGELLPRIADPNAMDATGQAAMTYAAAGGFPDIVRQLLNAGVDPNLQYGHGLTALMWAAGYEADVGPRTADSVLKLLLGRNARIDAVDDRGRTALMIAAEVGHSDVAETLLNRGADPMIRDRDGKTAFDLAYDVNVRHALATSQ
jgi:ankyrin repeat protein